MELVACTGEAAQSQALEAVMGLQVREAHLDALSLVTRSAERLRLHLSPGDVTSVLMHVAPDLPRWFVGTAPRFERASLTVALSRAVEARMIAGDRATCRQRFAGRAGVEVVCLVEAEVRSREGTVVALALSHTGMCGVIRFSFTSQPRKAPLP